MAGGQGRPFEAGRARLGLAGRYRQSRQERIGEDRRGLARRYRQSRQEWFGTAWLGNHGNHGRQGFTYQRERT